MTTFLRLSTCLASAAALSLAIVAPANADAERAQAQANFAKADLNKDGQLDLAEFTTFINLNADHNLGRASMIRRFGMHQKAFEQADTNRDGVVSKQEIAAQVQR
jgi:Ca2+-binding EF-hand superfamily protein